MLFLENRVSKQNPCDKKRNDSLKQRCSADHEGGKTHQESIKKETALLNQRLQENPTGF